ncbi:complex I 24 kDa subunit family protein [Syntrophobacter fumaroxidans]|uniref:NADH dehydrogenase (Ubiquinone), 24 kDa subunit n=1 Tax=Syntrophobacter fumaroxidans (strain DSM 10017 / MPOB) TaxID=335543 RepID=A0LGJ1_SYNFM|nr:NAD(P)H-dependent oxidoreductase subunit E [Syntrophobacter fumaroxidans]ABK16543.1 NADH dehydrogenase (ubiquinone), 24 kDa subunit [Syntrophobacter fumaroxidans MPOB]
MNGCECTPTDAALVKGLARIIEPYRGQPNSLIQVLAKAQEYIGYLPKWVQVQVAEGLGLSLQEIYGVTTFYAFFSLIPRGRHKLSVCAGTACYVKGTKNVLKGVRDAIGIKPGQTTPDSRFTMEIVRCIGACGLAPAVIVNGKDVHGRLEAEQIPEILSLYE